MIAVFSAILYLLVLTRLWDVAASHRRALGRERVVRQAGLSLVAAADVDQVAAAVQVAVGRPAPRPLARRRAARGADRRHVLRAAAAGSVRRRGPSSGQLAETWLPLVNGTVPLLPPMTGLPEQAAERRPRADVDAALPADAAGPAVGGHPL